MRFWSSDWHLSHDRILEFCPNREFSDVGKMNEAIINNTNAVVGPDDELWIIGDLAMGQFVESIRLFERLVCRNLFQVPGNHDKNHKMHPKWAYFQSAYEDVGLTVLDSQVIVMVGGQPTKVCHFPYRGDSHGLDRYSGLRPHDEGDWLICGHVHQAWKIKDRQINVGVDAWDLTPVPESEIEKILLDEVHEAY